MALRRSVAVVAAGVAGLLASCSGDDASGLASTASDPFAAADCVASDPLLLVDQISDAVAAVEAELGGAQRYYEINATPVVVNLFVAGDGDAVTPYAFAGGELSSQDPAAGASGNTFSADAIDFDPDTVTSCVTTELSTSTQEVFIVLGGPDGTAGYSVLTRSSAGGQLLVAVDGDGTVLGVDPV